MADKKSPIITAKKKENEKRGGGAGFLTSLLSKLGLGGGSGAGAGVGSGTIGASGAAGAQSFFNGLLATKAGIVALALTGTTIAGVVGTMGPQWLNLQMPPDGDHITFASPKAGSAPSRGGSGQSEAAPAADGSSMSLKYAQQPIAGGASESGAASAPATDVPSASAAQPDHNSAPNTTSASFQRPKMAASKGLGLSNGSSSGGGMSPSGNNFAPAPIGKLSAFSGGGSRSAVTGSSGRAGSRMAGAFGQAMAAAGGARNNLAGGNVSSAGSGTTYDGGRAGGTVGPAAGGLGGTGMSNGGAGAAKGAQNAQPTPNPVQNNPPPPITNTANSTPYQGLINAAIAALAIAGMAMLVGYLLKSKGQFQLAKLAYGIAAAAGAILTILGIVLFATYGQQLQGGLFTVVGGIITVMSTMNFLEENPAETEAAKKAAEQEAQERAASLARAQAQETPTVTMGSDGQPIVSGGMDGRGVADIEAAKAGAVPDVGSSNVSKGAVSAKSEVV